MKDKVVSIPESARLIAERYGVKATEIEWLIEFAGEVMKSERLACVRQLEAEAATYPNANGIIYMMAARLLCEGEIE